MSPQLKQEAIGWPKRAGVGPRRNNREVEPQAGARLVRYGPFFFSKSELQSGGVDRAELTEHGNTARKGEGEFDMHTNPKIRGDVPVR